MTKRKTPSDKTRAAKTRGANTRGAKSAAGHKSAGAPEPVDEPTAITTLQATKGADPQRVREWLIAERGIVTTYAEVQRAPFEMTAPVLRVSPHVDTTADDLELFAEALVAATAQV